MFVWLNALILGIFADHLKVLGFKLQSQKKKTKRSYLFSYIYGVKDAQPNGTVIQLKYKKKDFQTKKQKKNLTTFLEVTVPFHRNPQSLKLHCTKTSGLKSQWH